MKAVKPPNRTLVNLAENTHSFSFFQFLRFNALSLSSILIVTFYIFSLYEDSSLTKGLVAAGIIGTFYFICFSKTNAFVRPHPVFWNSVYVFSVLYLCLIVFLLFQDVTNIHRFLSQLDPALGQPLRFKEYTKNCQFNFYTNYYGSLQNVWDKCDIFVLAHFFGWAIKALILRDIWMLWGASLLFEWMEITFRYKLPNFRECWWDHVLLDIFGCNWFGMLLGFYIMKKFNFKKYDWKFTRNDIIYNNVVKNTITVSKDAHNRIFTSPKMFLTGIGVITLATLVDLNVFLLKAEVWLEPSHWIILLRTALVALSSTLATRDIYDYCTNASSYLGMSACVSIATVMAEILVSYRFRASLESGENIPSYIFIIWFILISFIIMYGYEIHCSHKKEIARLQEENKKNELEMYRQKIYYCRQQQQQQRYQVSQKMTKNLNVNSSRLLLRNFRFIFFPYKISASLQSWFLD